MRTIAIVNQKGGCGKTTTAINLAALYAQRGLRTLLVDMDPQSHCAAGLGVPEARIEYSIGHALLADHGKSFDADALAWEVSRNLYLAPSTMMLATLEAPGGGLHQLPDKDRRLESLLNAIGHRYDRCLIDCPPTVGLLTFNALRAARETLIPVETGFFSLRGAEKQWNTIQRLIQHIGRPIACHMVATLHDPNSKLACNILGALRRQFAGQILPMVIHDHESLREAASFGQPLIEYAPHSEARADFEALADWLDEHASRPAVEIEVVAEQSPRAAISTSTPLLAAPQPVAAGSTALGLPAVMAGPSRAPAPTASSATAGCASIAESRAAELVRRVYGLSARGAAIPTVALQPAAPAGASVLKPQISISSVPTHVPSPSALLLEALPESTDGQRPNDLSHLYGVRQTSAGVLFVQPAQTARGMFIAGDFNRWSPIATPMRLNHDLDLFETVVKLQPGAHQYRLVIDGRWVADSYNSQCQLNAYGEPNSVVVVSPLGPGT